MTMSTLRRQESEGSAGSESFGGEREEFFEFSYGNLSKQNKAHILRQPTLPFTQTSFGQNSPSTLDGRKEFEAFQRRSRLHLA